MAVGFVSVPRTSARPEAWLVQVPLVSDIVRLRPTLEKLARTTWPDIADGRQLGVGMGETGITDRNMLALRREHPSLLVHKHAVNEEVRTGADWEWWLDTGDGWMCLVFQAKVLDANGRYPGITKGQAGGKLQVDVLLRACLQRSLRLDGTVWPLYCFYNNWPGGWPIGVPRFDGANTRTINMTGLQLYGCAAADAWSVRRVLVDRHYSKRRTLRDSYLPVSRPWSMIFPDPAESAAYDPARTMIELSSWRYGQAQLEAGTPPSPELDSDQSESGNARRRDRGALYRDPVLISRPPDYVLDLLEGTAQPRRMKPIARRVLILPESV